MKWQRLVVIGLLVSVLLGGCWNRREPELLALITAVGFDYDAEADRYIIHLAVVNPLATQAGETGGGAPTTDMFWSISGSGLTPFGALRNLEGSTTRELYWAHARVVIIGEGLARRGIEDMLEFIERERQFRLTAFLAVVDGPIARLVSQAYPLEEEPGEALDRQILLTSLNLATIPPVNLRQASVVLSRPGLDLMLPRLEARPSHSGLDAPNPARASGSAVFSGKRMVGWFTEDETRGREVITGQLRRATLELEMEKPATGRIAVELVSAKTTVAARVSGDCVAIDIDIRADGRIQSHAGGMDLEFQGLHSEALERQVGDEVRRLVEKAVNRAKVLKADVFGFGELIYRTQPRTWERIKDEWPERLRELEVNTNVRVTITRTGLVVEPVRAR